MSTKLTTKSIEAIVKISDAIVNLTTHLPESLTSSEELEVFSNLTIGDFLDIPSRSGDEFMQRVEVAKMLCDKLNLGDDCLSIIEHEINRYNENYHYDII
jgi:hypothetical protein